jgi:2-dehydropantoate 2-reductase
VGTRPIRNIAVLGVGGVGGYFGGLIAHALRSQGDEERSVAFVARGLHLEAIRRNGLTLNTSEGTFTCVPHLVTDRISDIPRPDLCLVCVKSYDLPAVLETLTERIDGETIVLPLLNGVDIYDRVRAVLTGGVVLPSTVYVGTHIESPGVVTQRGGGTILTGPDPASPDFDPREFLSLFRDTGIKVEWLPNSFGAIWEKFIFIGAFGLVTALTGKTLGAVLDDNELRGTVRAVMEEVVSLARARGIDLPPGVIESSLEKARVFPHETKTSYQRDLEDPGKKNEGDLFGGTIVRLGASLGVPTPVTRSIYERLQP